jgi:hypothetical protein
VSSYTWETVERSKASVGSKTLNPRTNYAPLLFSLRRPLDARSAMYLQRTAGNVAVATVVEGSNALLSQSVQRCGLHAQACSCHSQSEEPAGVRSLQRSEEPASDEKFGEEDPCAGWKTDPQSFSIQLARHYYRTEFKNRKSQNPSPNSVRPGSSPDQWIVQFDNGDEVTIDMANVRQGKASAKSEPPGDHCDYAFTCSYSGSIAFSKLQCRSEVF